MAFFFMMKLELHHDRMCLRWHGIICQSFPYLFLNLLFNIDKNVPLKKSIIIIIEMDTSEDWALYHMYLINKVFSPKMVMLHIKLKGMTHTTTCKQ